MESYDLCKGYEIVPIHSCVIGFKVIRIGGILKELHCEPEDSYNYKQDYLNINSLIYGHG